MSSRCFNFLIFSFEIFSIFSIKKTFAGSHVNININQSLGAPFALQPRVNPAGALNFTVEIIIYGGGKGTLDLIRCAPALDIIRAPVTEVTTERRFSRFRWYVEIYAGISAYLENRSIT